jgi:hypothetical protein
MKKKSTKSPRPQPHAAAVRALEARGFRYGAPMWVSVETLARDCQATWAFTCPVCGNEGLHYEPWHNPKTREHVVLGKPLSYRSAGAHGPHPADDPLMALVESSQSSGEDGGPARRRGPRPPGSGGVR